MKPVTIDSSYGYMLQTESCEPVKSNFPKKEGENRTEPDFHSLRPRLQPSGERTQEKELLSKKSRQSEAEVRPRLRRSRRASLCEKASPQAAQQVADNEMRTRSHRQFVTKRAADNKMRTCSGKRGRVRKASKRE